MRRSEFITRMAAAAVLIGGFASPASAVDIVSREKVARDIVINRVDGSSDTITIKPGEKLAAVCEECIVLLGNTSVEASGKVRVEGGKVSLSQR